MSDPSNVNRLLAENCENCRVTAKQNADGSSVTKFSYEFCLQQMAAGFVGETPKFSTGRTGSKLDWLLKFGPDFRLNLHLLKWDGCDDVKVHVICCWKLPFVENGYIAINENLDPRLPLPSFWSVKLPRLPPWAGSDFTSHGTDFNGKLLLDISLEDRVSGRAEYLSQYLASTLESGRFSDVTLVAGDRRFPAHRAILSQRCPGILENRSDDSDQTIFMTDIDPGVLEMVLEFLYTGRLKNIEESRLEALLVTAYKWSLPDLQHFCADLIRRRYTQEFRQGISVATPANNVVTLSIDYMA